MSTLKQRTANAANAQHSTGPRSLSAIEAVKNNATKHGLTSKQILIPGEDPEAFESLKNALEEDHQPANTHEQILVNQIAEHLWRLFRARGIETTTFQRKMRSLEPRPHEPGEMHRRVPATHTESATACFHDNPKIFDNLRRYETSIERAYYRAINQLAKLQKERRANEEKQTPNLKIGIVSQKPEPVRQPDPIDTLVFRATPSGTPKTQPEPPNLVPSH